MGREPVLIFLSRSHETRETLARDLDGLRSEFPDLKINGMDMSALSVAAASAPQIVVLDLENWVPSDEMALSDLRAQGYDGPVVVLTKRIDEASSSSYASERVVFFDRGRGGKELLGITRRLILGSIIAARKHPRHPTDQTAEIQIEGQPHIYNCRVRNLSKGGAYLEIERAVNMRVGSTVFLKIHLNQVGKVYSVRARVAWLKLPGFGVEFIGE